MPLTLIAEPDGVFSQRLVDAASLGVDTEVCLVGDLETALEMCQQKSPEVLVVGPTLIDSDALELAVFLSGAGHTACVFAPSQVDAVMLREAMRAGVTDAVAITDETSELASAIEHARTAARRARGVVPLAGEESGPTATVLTVFSTKGGVGKTVLSTNLAVALASAGKRVCIVDLDVEFGDVGIMMGIKPVRTLFDVVQAYDRLDTEMLGGFLEDHSSGAKALLAPVRPEDAEAVSATRISRILGLLRGSFDYIVVDTSPSFSDVVLAALDRSDRIYVVTMMDVASIKNTRISLQKLHQLGYDNDRLQLVLNRADSKVLLELNEVEQAVGGNVAARIPSDRVVPRSVNKGVPVVIDAPKCDVSKAILGLAKSAMESPSKEASHVA